MASNSGSGAPTLGEMISGEVPIPVAVLTPPTPAPVTPTNSAEATARLNELQRDAGWRDRLLAGHGSEAKEYRTLRDMITQGDPVDKAMAGIMDDAPFQSSGHLLNVAATQMFREMGIDDGAIRQTLTGHEVTQEEYNAVARLKAERLRDPEWVEQFLAGSASHKRDSMLMNIVLSSSIKKAVA